MSFSSPLKMLEKYSNLKQKHFLSLVFTGSAKFMPLNDTFFANNSLWNKNIIKKRRWNNHKTKPVGKISHD